MNRYRFYQIIQAHKNGEDLSVFVPKNAPEAELIAALQGGGSDGGTVKSLFDNTKKTTNYFQNYANDNISELLSYDDTSEVTDMSSMFYFAKGITSIPKLNTSKAENMKSMFGYCSNLETIPQLDMSNVSNTNGMFRDCTNLKHVPELNTAKVTDMQYMFSGCANLEVIESIDVGNATSFYMFLDKCANLKSLRMLNIKVSFNMTQSNNVNGQLLDVDSLVGLCKECVNMNESCYLTIGSTNMEKLANVYVKFVDASQTEIAVYEKGEVVICESTDTGAMTINEYMTLKKWSVRAS